MRGRLVGAWLAGVASGCGPGVGGLADARLDADASFGPGQGDFGAPTPAALGVGRAPNQEPSVNADGTVLVYRSATFPEVNGVDTLFAATRAARSMPWTDHHPMLAINNGGNGHTAPTLAPDASWLVYWHGSGVIFRGQRAPDEARWPATAEVALAPGLAVTSLALSGDELTAVIAGDDGAGPRLFEARRVDVAAPWPTPQPILGLTQAAPDGPWLDQTGDRLAYHAVGPDGDLDIYGAERADGTFADGVRWDALCSPDDDTAPSFTADLRYAVLARRSSTGGLWGLWSLVESSR